MYKRQTGDTPTPDGSAPDPDADPGPPGPEGSVDGAPSTGASTDRGPSHPWRWITGMLVIGFALAGFGSAFVRIPYYTVSPGTVRPTEPRIEVSGAPSFESEGQIDFLTVSLRPATALEGLVGWLDPNVEVVDEDLILGDRDADENRQVNQRLMTDAKQIATYVALTELGYGVTVEGTGATVVAVGEGTPAAGLLEPGDTIVAVDGEPILLAGELVDAIGAHAPGDTVSLDVEPPDGSEARTVDVTLAEREEDPSKALLGVSTQTRDERYEFPVTVTVDTGTVGGPSAGLALTLGILDRMTPGDLTGGLNVAVTGTMSPDGVVGPVGGVPQKVVAARRAGADLMIVPVEEYDDAVAQAGDLRVEKAATLDEALDLLEQFGGGIDPVSGGEQASGPTTTTQGD